MEREAALERFKADMESAETKADAAARNAARDHAQELNAQRVRYETALKNMEMALRQRAEEAVGALEGEHRGELESVRAQMQLHESKAVEEVTRQWRQEQAQRREMEEQHSRETAQWRRQVDALRVQVETEKSNLAQVS